MIIISSGEQIHCEQQDNENNIKIINMSYYTSGYTNAELLYVNRFLRQMMTSRRGLLNLRTTEDTTGVAGNRK